MKRQYYYTVASLPSLSFHEPSPLSPEDALALCKAELTVADNALLKSITLSPHAHKEMYLSVKRKWFAFEKALRNELVRLRATKLGVDADLYIRGDDGDRSYAKLAQDIFATESPHIAEEMIDHARWKFLDELETDYYFTIEKLVIYFLKLRILERRSFFNTEAGRKNLDDIINQVEDYDITFQIKKSESKTEW